MANKVYNSVSDALRDAQGDLDKQMWDELEFKAQALLNDINQLWAGYMKSYTPSVYIRREENPTQAGFSLSKIEKEFVTEDTFRYIATIELNDENMWHTSWFNNPDNPYTSSKQYPKGHSFMLISEGWRAPALEAYIGVREHFTRFDGVGIIDMLISKYNTNGFEFKFYYNGVEYGGKKDRNKHSFTQ